MKHSGLEQISEGGMNWPARSFKCQTLRSLLTLAVLESQNVPLGEVERVLERGQGYDELLQLYVLVKNNVLHLAPMLDFESIHLVVVHLLFK